MQLATHVKRGTTHDLREKIRKTYRETEHPATLVELCDQYLKAEPDDGIVWAWYGHSLIALARFDVARAALERAGALVGENEQRAFVLRCLGDLEYAQGRHAEAQVLYCEAFALAPEYDAALIAAGRAAFGQGDLEGAEAAFRKAASVNGPFRGAALYEVGRVLRARGAFFEARRVLKQALDLVPQDPRLREMLADVEAAMRVRSHSQPPPDPLK
jgi:tetratricopeptide (TPR) repeat protein